jgi:hypothetical protein
VIQYIKPAKHPGEVIQYIKPASRPSIQLRPYSTSSHSEPAKHPG